MNFFPRKLLLKILGCTIPGSFLFAAEGVVHSSSERSLHKVKQGISGSFSLDSLSIAQQADRYGDILEVIPKVDRSQYAVNIAIQHGINLIKEIGSGSFGRVYQAQDLKTKELVAVKYVVMETSSETYETELESIKREIEIMGKIKAHYENARVDIDDRDIVTIKRSWEHIGTEEEVHIICIVMEYMDLTLSDAIKINAGKLVTDHHQYFMMQLLSGLEVMHSLGVIHRDIKPANLLVNEKAKLKICDFGLALNIYIGQPLDNEYTQSRWWRAWEILSGQPYNEKIDVWSSGIILLHLLYGNHFITGDTEEAVKQQLVGALNTKNFLERTLNPTKNPKTKEAIQLARKLLAWDPAIRLSATNALAEPFFKE